MDTPTPPDGPHERRTRVEPAPVDFSGARSLEDIMQLVVRMAEQGDSFTTADGSYRFSPKDLSTHIEKAARAVIHAGVQVEPVPNFRPLSPDRIDEVLSQEGISSQRGLRAAMVRVLQGSEWISGQVFDLAAKVRGEGKYSPVWTIPEDVFQRMYPERQYPDTPSPGDMSDLNWQVTLRWRDLRQAADMKVRQVEIQRTRNWEEARQRAVFQPEWLQHPSSSDHYAQYARAQEKNRTEREAAEREARRKGFARIGGIGDQNGISAKIGLMLTGGKPPQLLYEGLNYVRAATDRLEPKITRTLVLPIDGAPSGQTISITLLSEAEIPERSIPREVPEQFQAVMLETVGPLKVYAGERPTTPEQRRVVELARTQMRAAEEQIKASFGITLGIDQQLAHMLE